MKAHQAHARPQPVQRERETQASRPGWLARNRRTGSPGVRRGALIVVILACLSFAFAASAQTPPPQSFPDLDLVKGGSIQAVAHQPDGGIVIGGTFTRVHGVPRSNIARLHPDGTLDMDWNPDADGAVQALAVDVDGAVFVGGTFAGIGGQTRRFVAKLAGAGTGAAAPDWAPTANNAVEALALDENGDLYIGGSFSLIDQQPRLRIARIAANGILDPDWNPGANSRVATLALAPGPGGTLYAGGAFTHIGGMERNRIARLSRNGTGAVDPDWNPSANGPVLALAVDDSGAVYAGGSFGQVNGEPRPYLVKLSASGSGQADPVWKPTPGYLVQSLALDGAGSVYAGGMFRTVDGVPRNRLVRLSGSGAGTVDPHWAPSANGDVAALSLDSDGTLVAGGEFNRIDGEQAMGVAMISDTGTVVGHGVVEQPGKVEALAWQPDGGLIVGGDFVAVNGLSLEGLLRMRPNGLPDPDWAAATEGVVHALAVDADGNIHVGGLFGQVGGLARNNLARLHADGQVDASWAPSPAGVVSSLAMHPDGSLFVAGSFSTVDGLPRRIARISVAGNVDPDWAVAANGIISTVVLDDSGRVYIGGSFSTIGGVPRSNLARLSGSGSGTLDPDWNPAADGTISALVVGAGDVVFVGGYFSHIDGLPRTRLARIVSSGSVDPGWSPAVNSLIQTMLLDGPDTLYIGGAFTQVDGQPRARLARLAASGDGTVDADWHPGANSVVHALAHHPSGRILVGGWFTRTGNLPRVGLASFQSDVDLILANGFEQAIP